MYKEIPEEIIDTIRTSNDIVDVIGEYVQLKKQGRNYFGLCPFHDEKSPSFSVTEDKQLFHCFGCGKSGNVISFMMEVETLSFIETIKHLADRTGVTLPETKSKQPKLSEESTTLLSAYDWLTKYYLHFLKYHDDAKDGLAYFQARGISEQTIDRFQLGFAPVDSDFTVDFLQNKGFHQQSLVKAGLLTARDNNMYVDPFRGRVIFPIKNHLGKTVAFGGRSIKDENPKYLNSSEHELFQKGSILYNYDLARNHIRKQNEVIIFEGYMDVLTADQAGIRNVIATLGTALSVHQARLLRRYVDTVILCFDSDAAGQKGSYQAAKLLHENGCTVKIAKTKENMDPDQYIKQYGSEKFQEQVIETSDTYVKFLINYKRKDYNLAIDSERIAYIEETTKTLAMVESDIEREYYVKELADEFDLAIETIQNSIAQLNKNKPQVNNKDNSAQNSYTKHKISYQQEQVMYPAYHNAEITLLSHMLTNPYVLDRVQQELGVNFNIEEHQIILTHLYALYEEKNKISVSDLIDKLDSDHLKKIITEIAFMQVNEEHTEDEINDYIRTIQQQTIENTKVRSLKEQQRELEEQNDPILAAKIGLELLKLRNK